MQLGYICMQFLREYCSSSIVPQVKSLGTSALKDFVSVLYESKILLEIINQTNLSLFVWLQPKQAADLMRCRVNDASTHHIVGVWIDTVEQLHAKTGEFVFGASQVKGDLSFEYFLGALLFTVESK